jgi:hypothetical protein
VGGWEPFAHRLEQENPDLLQRIHATKPTSVSAKVTIRSDYWDHPNDALLRLKDEIKNRTHKDTALIDQLQAEVNDLREPGSVLWRDYGDTFGAEDKEMNKLKGIDEKYKFARMTTRMVIIGSDGYVEEALFIGSMRNQFHHLTQKRLPVLIKSEEMPITYCDFINRMSDEMRKESNVYS